MWWHVCGCEPDRYRCTAKHREFDHARLHQKAKSAVFRNPSRDDRSPCAVLGAKR